MEAIKEIIHVSGNTLQIHVPSFLNDQDVEVIIFPSTSEKRHGFNPSQFYGITHKPESEIVSDTKKLRNEWERRA